ncbi:MAG: heavy metal translocating P-type ATPase, partial [Oscillospiraceae bacterium]
FLIPLMYISMGHMWGLPLPSFLMGHQNAIAFAFSQFLLCLPIVYINMGYFTKGFYTLFHGSPNMDSLIAVGSSSALIYGIFAIYRIGYGLGVGDMELVARYHMDLYFESAATILTLITLGKFLEAKSKGKTGEALSKLIDLAPKTALVERNGSEITLPIEEVVLGVLVKPGSSIPVDGVVTQGRTSVDEAAITGESMPVYKQEGMSVIGATLNKSGFIKVRATKVGQDTAFAQIIKLVEDASATKAPIAKIADKIAGVFVPVVMSIALVTGIVWFMSGSSFEFALSSAITVLVISCPCALGLATPVAIMVGTGKGAENGILIKSGEALETAHSINTVVLDKTGTITQGKPTVTDVIAMGLSKKDFIQLAASLEAKSEHPLAAAIVEHAKQNDLSLLVSEGFFAIEGKGLCATVDGSEYYAGNSRLMEEQGISILEHMDRINALAAQGKTPLIFAKNKVIIGIIAVADTVKSDSKVAIEQLRKMGLEVIMLTGDNQITAHGIGEGLNLSEIIAEVLPSDKAMIVEELQKSGKKVAMVGDGINDAPALARADVGIAIGTGTDVAIESADIILMRDSLVGVVTAIRLSKAVIRNIKQNLFWAFFYNCLGIPLAAGVFYSTLGWKLSPMFGAAAMSFSSLFVVTNALRLKLFKATETDTIDNSRQEYIDIETKEKDSMVILKIEGMMCGHCVKHVQAALDGIEGVTATVDLEKNQATVTSKTAIDTDLLVAAVKNAGYEVTQVITE